MQELMKLLEMFSKFSDVPRQLWLPGAYRRERDGDHSWMLATTAWLILSRRKDHGLNIERVVTYALIHDLVEVYSGDTMFHDPAANATKHEREAAALARIEVECSEHWPALVAALHAYERREDAEARFVWLLDKLIPFYLNMLTEGVAWKEISMTPEHLLKLKQEKFAQTLDLDTELLEMFQELSAAVEARPDFFTGEPFVPVSLGKYRHQDGRIFEVTDIAMHAFVNEPLVVGRFADAEAATVYPRIAFSEQFTRL